MVKKSISIRTGRTNISAAKCVLELDDGVSSGD